MREPQREVPHVVFFCLSKMIVVPSDGEIYFVKFTHFKRKVVFSPANVISGFWKAFVVVVQHNIAGIWVVVQLTLVINFTSVLLFT